MIKPHHRMAEFLSKRAAEVSREPADVLREAGVDEREIEAILQGEKIPRSRNIHPIATLLHCQPAELGNLLVRADSPPMDENKLRSVFRPLSLKEKLSIWWRKFKEARR